MKIYVVGNELQKQKNYTHNKNSNKHFTVNKSVSQ